jgi:hypothetical protein
LNGAAQSVKVNISTKDCTYGRALICAAIAEAGGRGGLDLNSKQYNAELIGASLEELTND